MATLFLLLAGGHLERLACPADAPLFLDAAGSVLADDWTVAIVPFAASAGAPRRWALVAAPGVDVVIGGRELDEGIAELQDREHFLVGACEAVLGTDALPEPVPATDPPQPCPVCCETLDAERRLHRCPRCGQQACTRCWQLAPRAECLTPECGQPAALARTLWEPALSEFVCAEET